MSGGITRGAADPFGVLLIALASLSYAVATAIAKRSTVGLDPIGLATTQLSLAGLMLLPVALTGPRPTDVSAPSLLAVTALGVLGSGLAYLLFYSLLSRVSSTQVSAVAYLLPVWGPAACPVSYTDAGSEGFRDTPALARHAGQRAETPWPFARQAQRQPVRPRETLPGGEEGGIVSQFPGSRLAVIPPAAPLCLNASLDR